MNPEEVPDGFGAIYYPESGLRFSGNFKVVQNALSKIENSKLVSQLCRMANVTEEGS